MIHQTSKGLASLGRHGDTMLVHMSPHEVAGLQGLAMAHGTSMTINPHTGLPEAFNLGRMFTSFLPTIVGGLVGGPMGMGLMGGVLAGAATGAGVAAAQGDNALMGGLTGAMGGWGGTGIADAFKAAGASGIGGAASGAGSTIGNTAQTVAGNVGGTGEIGSSLLKSGVTPGAESTLSSQISPFTNNTLGSSLGVAPGANTAGAITPGGYDVAANSLTGQVNQTGTGIKNLLGLGDKAGTQSAAWNAAKSATSNLGTKLALTGAGGVLGGLEPSDLYPDVKPTEDKYDPYAKLSLSNDTGLRLLAGGGPVSGAGDIASSQQGGNYNTYGTSDSMNNTSLSQDGFGLGRLEALASQASGAKTSNQQAFVGGGYLNGRGDGMSDSIPATINGQKPARLADGEFVVPADVVSHLGNGSSKAGSQRLYSMLDKVRQARTGRKSQGKQINPDSYLPA